MAKKLFITGTGTDVGKTFVSGLILKKLVDSGLKPGYFKAAMSGNVRNERGALIPGDATWVKNVSRVEQSVESMCPYVYEAAVSPHLASRLEGNPVRMDVVKNAFKTLCANYDYITMEGSGGILCPICFDEEKIWLEDVVRELNIPCLIVADAGLGTINNVILTVEYMRSKGLTIQGLVFNRFHSGDVMEEDNLRMCEYATGVKALACVRGDAQELDMDVETLKSLYLE